jgi:hypothetical protein
MFLKSDFCNRNNVTFNACLNHMYEVRQAVANAS